MILYTQEKQSRLRSFLLVVMTLLTILLLMNILLIIFLHPRERLERIQVEGGTSLGNKDLLFLTGLETGVSFHDVRPEAIQERLETLPYVEHVTVAKRYPRTLHIALTERKSLVMALVEKEGFSYPVVFDRQGVLYVRGDKNLADEDVPILSGIQLETVEIGAKLPGEITPLLVGLESLRTESPALYRWVSEIHILPRGQGDYDLLLYPVSTPIRMRLKDPHLTTLLLRRMAIVADFLTQKRQGKVEEVDFSMDRIVYSMQGDGRGNVR